MYLYLIRLSLNEVGNVHRHLVDLCVVELLNVLEVALVVVGDEVDGHSLPTESSSSSNSKCTNIKRCNFPQLILLHS